MPLTRTAKTFSTAYGASHATRRLRPANPSCRGGASSVLRLAQPVAQRLPTTLDLSDWMSHAASVLMPVTGPLTDFNARSRASGV
ncbi:MAG: hypothetical protein KGL99_02785 [Burkholderiales bacterium]|nr:hypothetical protein [Burkholderiales bacterium]